MSSSSSPARPGSAQASSRKSSAQAAAQHAPLNPSQLRTSHEPGRSPERSMSILQSEDDQFSPGSHPTHADDSGLHSTPSDPAFPFADSANTQVLGNIDEPSKDDVDAHTSLLQCYDRGAGCGSKNCNHGTFSPRPTMRRGFMSYDSGARVGRSYGGDSDASSGNSNIMQRIFGGGAADVVSSDRKGKKMSTTQMLAKKHGVKTSKKMYVNSEIKILREKGVRRHLQIESSVIMTSLADRRGSL